MLLVQNQANSWGPLERAGSPPRGHGWGKLATSKVPKQTEVKSGSACGSVLAAQTQLTHLQDDLL